MTCVRKKSIVKRDEVSEATVLKMRKMAAMVKSEWAEKNGC